MTKFDFDKENNENVSHFVCHDNKVPTSRPPRRADPGSFVQVKMPPHSTHLISLVFRNGKYYKPLNTRQINFESFENELSLNEKAMLGLISHRNFHLFKCRLFAMTNTGERWGGGERTESLFGEKAAMNYCIFCSSLDLSHAAVRSPAVDFGLSPKQMFAPEKETNKGLE